MPRRKRVFGTRSMIPYLLVAIMVISGYIFLMYGEDLLGLTGVSTIYVGYIAPLIGFGTLGYLVLEYPSRNMVTFSLLAAGVLFAILLGEMNTNGLLVDNIVSSSVTITELQGIVIVVGALLGLIVRTYR